MNALTQLLCLLLLLSGCAMNGTHEPHDPFEGYNRTVHEFNDKFDRTLLRPLAEGYVAFTPSAIRTAVGNFFSNLDDVLVLFNDLFQIKFSQATSDLYRIVWNTTVGIFGLIDVATPLDLPKHNEDFGQTLGYWGVGSGPYLVWPLLGPSSLRDTTGLVVDWEIEPISISWGLAVLNVVDIRAGLLRTTEILDAASIDPYAFMRDAYLQRRQYLTYDGPPPTVDEFDPFAEEFDPLSEDPITEPTPDYTP